MNVSIVMATYNGGRFIRTQLNSLINQTYPIYELIIRDDASTDNTWVILEEYAQKYPFIHIRKNTERRGVNENFFSAMEEAKGDLIAICDQDDEWEKDKIENQVNSIGDKWLCGGFSKPFSEVESLAFDNRIPNCNIERIIHIASALGGHTMLIRREILPLILKFRDRNILYDHLISIIAGSYNQIIFVDKVLVNHRMHPDSRTFTVPVMEISGRESHSFSNMIRSFFRTLFLYIEIRHQIGEWFAMIYQILLSLPDESPRIKDALKIAKYQSDKSLISYIKLTFMYVKVRRKIFHVEEKNSILAILRAIYFPISGSDYFRYMSKSFQSKK